jgi:hypothetical protein
MKGKKIAAAISSIALLASMSAPAFASDRGYHLGQLTDDHDDQKKVYQFNFIDVDGDFSWAKKAIAKLAEQKVVSGIDKTHFNPGGTITRAQFATLLSRYFHLQTTNNTTQDYQDVSNKDWFFPYVEAAKDYMTAFQEPNGQYYFEPNRPVNRAEAAVTLVKILQKENIVQLVSNDQADTILSAYKDANEIPVNLRAYVATAIHSGVMVGVKPDRFDPLSNLNRAQVAALFYNIENQLEVLPQSDGTSTGLIEVVPGSNSSTTNSTDTSAPLTLQLSAPGTLLHDQSYAFTLTVFKNGSVDTAINGTYTMKVTTTDSAHESSDVQVTFTNGVAQIPVVLSATGNQTVTISNDALGVSGSVTVTVQ